ncbi:MAG: PRC-barrel domain-containing protein [Theionarchaea archaeon]|nr:PRC-barrel domain-containing protein [Theionarchaea archaeon]
MAKIAASRIRDRMVVTSQGHEVGLLFDIVTDEKTGKCEPTTEEMRELLLTDREGLVLIPFTALRAIRDFIVVDAKRVPRKIKKVGMFAKRESTV